MRTIRSAAACWLAAGIAYPCLEAVAAAAHPGYRYAQDMISDLGRPDSPLHAVMNTAFVVQGTLFFAGAATSSRAVRADGGRGARAFLACAAANAVGNVAVASVSSGSVPSGPGGIAWVHVTGAVLAIVGGNAAIVAGAPIVGSLVGKPHGFRTVSTALAAAGLLSFGCLAVASKASTTALLPDAVLGADQRLHDHRVADVGGSAAVDPGSY